jgi:hypothetical protein
LIDIRNRIDELQAGHPPMWSAWKNASHYVFQSNEADVLRDMNAFLAGLR